MPSNRFGPRFVPLRFVAARCFSPATTISRTEVIALHGRLETIRRAMLDESESAERPSFIEFPERMFDEYELLRRKSALGEILALAKRLREAVDRMVVVSSAAGLLNCRALIEAGCHPYHNEMSRGDRGGRPRIYFAGADFDNDAMQGLLDLLSSARPATSVTERWAIIHSEDRHAFDEPPATRAVLATLLPALRDSCDGNETDLEKLFVAVGEREQSLHCKLRGTACTMIAAPRGDRPKQMMFTAAGLLPAAVMGLDIVALLKGAVLITERFRAAAVGDNPVMDFAGISNVVRGIAKSGGRRVIPWANALHGAAEWAESGMSSHGCESAGLAVNLIAEAMRRDRIVVPESSVDASARSSFGCGGGTLPEYQATAIKRLNDERSSHGRPTAELFLPTLEESSLGQFFQMLLLADEIERRLSDPMLLESTL